MCDPGSIHLASTSAPSIDQGQLAVWRMAEILNSRDSQSPTPCLFDGVSHSAPIKALAWDPLASGLLVTGGSTRNDSVIRLYDVNSLSGETMSFNGVVQSSHSDVIHSIKCNSVITSLNFRKTRLPVKGNDSFGAHELVSTHGDPDCEMKLWQLNKYRPRGESLCINGKKVEYWFTKVKDFNCHQS